VEINFLFKLSLLIRDYTEETNIISLHRVFNMREAKCKARSIRKNENKRGREPSELSFIIKKLKICVTISSFSFLKMNG